MVQLIGSVRMNVSPRYHPTVGLPLRGSAHFGHVRSTRVSNWKYITINWFLELTGYNENYNLEITSI